MIKLELSLEEVQLVVNALGNLPFGQVEAIIGNIRNQAVEQMNPPDQTEPKNPGDPKND